MKKKEDNHQEKSGCRSRKKRTSVKKRGFGKEKRGYRSRKKEEIDQKKRISVKRKEDID